MKKQTSPRIVRRETSPKMTGRDGYRKAELHLRRDFDYRCAYCMVHEQQLGGAKAFCIDHFKPLYHSAEHGFCSLTAFEDKILSIRNSIKENKPNAKDNYYSYLHNFSRDESDNWGNKF